MIRATHAGDWPAARALNARLAESCRFEASETYPNPMPSKAAMRFVGFAVGECRLPLGPGDETLDHAARDVVSALAASRG